MSVYSKLFLVAVIFISALFAQDSILAAGDKIPCIKIIGDSIYLDGKKFFIKGIGYSPYRPGQLPGSPIPMEIVEADFKRIKEAGFNTLRVWDTMPKEQLELAEKYNLKVIQAAYLQPNVDFKYSGYMRMAESKVRQMCKLSRNHPNVIMYLIMNEPHAQAIMNSGVDNTLNLYKQLIEIIRQEDPNRPVSIANAYWTLWLDQSMWDVVCFNAYSYTAPVAGIGFANFVKGLKSLHSKDKPLVVTEFGLSVSPKGSAGYGGNTEKEQADGLVDCFRKLIEGGAVGGCVFEWNDEWWKEGTPDVHNENAEEWFGIIGIDNKKDTLGVPREAYYRLRDELKLIVIQPKQGRRILGQTDIEVNTSQEITNVRYRIDNGEWINLTKRDQWWRGTIEGSNLKSGLHTLAVKGIEKEKDLIRTLNIIKVSDEKDLSSPINLELTTDKSSYKNGDIIKIIASVRDKEERPLKNCYVKLGILNSTNNYNRCWEGLTDVDGTFSKTIPVIGNLNEWYYIYWVGTEFEDYGYKKSEGKIGYVKADIGEGIPIKLAIAQKTEKIKIDGVMEDAWLKADKIEIDADTNFAEGSIDSSNDLSAEIRTLWDENNIYILAHVKDDIPMMNKNRGIDIWNGDCIELFISVDPTKIPQEGYSDSDFQILIGANGEMWIPGQRRGGIRNNIPVLSKQVTKRSGTGYVLEAKINIANFYDKPTRLFRKGDVLGFDVAIGDRDLKEVREGKLVWNGTADGYKDSIVWGRLRLE